MLTIGSLFSGIGGLELGLERAGLGPVVWQVECEPFPLGVLAEHWPEATRYTDVKKVGNELAPVDIICGGFPCQDISNAGNRAGIGGARSGLWSEFARIVGVVRPRFVVVENVSALLARGMGVVLRDLASLGYDAIWDCVPAAAVGAPHRRDRLFVVAWRVSDPKRDGIRQQSERGQGAAQAPDCRDAFARNVGAVAQDVANGYQYRSQGERGDVPEDTNTQPWRDPNRRCCEKLANSNRERRGKGRAGESIRQRGSAPFGAGVYPPSPGNLHAWGQVQADAQPSVCRLADGVSDGPLRHRADKLKAYGNAVVPQVAEVIGHVIKAIMTPPALENPGNQ